MPRRKWEIPERQATDEAVYLNRRKFIRRAGLGSIGLLTGCIPEKLFNPVDLVNPEDFLTPVSVEPAERYPAPLNPSFSTLDRPLTDEGVAGIYNNFWEFTDTKWVTEYIDKFETPSLDGGNNRPGGRAEDLGRRKNLIGRMDLEERLYRHRCVEAWSMAIPWTGFPMKALVDLVQPLSSARYVRMNSFFNPEVAPNQWDQPDYPWPYTEGTDPGRKRQMS